MLLIVDTPETHPLLAASVEELHRTRGAAPDIASTHAILRTLGSAIDADIPLPPAGQAIEKAKELAAKAANASKAKRLKFPDLFIPGSLKGGR